MQKRRAIRKLCNNHKRTVVFDEDGYIISFARSDQILDKFMMREYDDFLNYYF